MQAAVGLQHAKPQRPLQRDQHHVLEMARLAEPVMGERDGVDIAFDDRADAEARRHDGGEIDILVCSSIIENGLDVPNANTLIVNRADHFGLSQLYQIRGRVGRSDRRAYCYLITPDDLNNDAQRRLKILEHYTELGSGYSVALRDMEMRGAGNLLGGDQSGFAQAVGVDTYMRLLEKTVSNLKGRAQEQVWPDPEITMVGSAYLPDEYISDSGQKLHLYRRLSKLVHLSQVDSLREELVDRFGSPPPTVEHLLQATSLRILGRNLGAEQIIVREREARVNFLPAVIPRLSVLEDPLRDRRVEMEVRRMTPLSVVFRQREADELISTLILALTALLDTQSARVRSHDIQPGENGA